MGFLSKIGKFFLPPPPTSRFLEFQVKCGRCGEILAGRVDTFNDPSLDEEDGKLIYRCRKVLIGSGHCFQPVETTFTFDKDRQVIARQVNGGEFIA